MSVENHFFPERRVSFIDRPKKLNVLNEDVVNGLSELFDYDSSFNGELIVGGNGPKSFCAGGDVVDVVMSVRNGRDWDFFFKQEYVLDQKFHLSQIPVTCFSHGFIMGGGMGILHGCKEKIIRENSVLSMPEVTIGFFPDVGASYFLQKLPLRWQRFLALTGGRLSEYWAKELGWVSTIVSDESYWKAIDLLKTNNNDWRDHLVHLDTPSEVLSDFLEVYDALAIVEDFNSLEDFDDWITGLSTENIFLAEARDIYLSGSPVCKVVTWDMIEWAQGKSVEECFVKDLHYANICSNEGDFNEGVRALLMDKDKNPKWKDSSISESYHRIKDLL